jgi:hypothetical protein
MDLAKALADMRANGVSEAQYEEKPDGSVTLKVAFGAVPALADRSGKAVNLDEGMGPLEVDPLGEEDEGNRPEGPADVAHAANFPPKPVVDAAG